MLHTPVSALRNLLVLTGMLLVGLLLVPMTAQVAWATPPQQEGAEPSVQFESAAYTVDEGGGPATITATLSATSSLPISVTYATGDGTATEGSDYLAATGTLTFAPGQISQTFNVTITDDLLDEIDETIELELSNPVSATLGTPFTAILTIFDDDPPSVQLTSASYSVNEDGGPATITATLSATSSLPISVTYATGDGTASEGSDYLAATGTLAFAPGQLSQTFSVTITDDLLDEADETLELELSNPVSATLGTPFTATLTIVDDDAPPSVQLTSAAYSVDEDGGPATITATLSATSGLTVSVLYATKSGTAVPSNDYLPLSRVLTFAPGETSRTFSVTILDDIFYEADETLSLLLSIPTNATLGTPSTATLTILDEDPPPSVQFTAAAYSVDEDAGPAVITATLNVPSGLPASVDYATSDGTASAGSDYSAASGSLTFNPPVQIMVQATLERTTDTSLYDPPSPDPAGAAYLSHLDRLLISDSEVDEMPQYFTGDNLFAATLSGDLIETSTTLGFPSYEPTGVAYNPFNKHLFFSDDVAKRVFELNPGGDGLYGTPDDLVTWFSTSAFGSFDPEGITFDTLRGYLFLTDGMGSTAYQITPGTNGIFDGVTPPGDDQVTHFDSSRLGVRDVEGLEFDPDNGHLYLLGITRGVHAVAEATIDGKLIRYIGLSSLPMLNSGGLAYAPSSTDPAQWHLYIVDRGIDNDEDPNENDGKLFEISFPSAQISQTFNVPIIDDLLDEEDETLELALSDPVSATLGTPFTATLTILDDDAQPSVQFEAASFSVDESASSAIITATLSEVSEQTVSVDYATSDGTASAGSDYLAASGTLTFDAGVITQTFSVTITDDLLDEADETLDLVLSDPVSATLGTPFTATLTILDDDAPPSVQFESAAYTVEEGGGSAIITATLSVTSGLPISVDYASSDGTASAGSDYLAATGTLAFAPGQISQTFSVTITDDTLDEADETLGLALSDPVNATLGTPFTATLTILDDDAPPSVQFEAASFSVDESAGSATIIATLSAASSLPISVDYATSDGTASAGSDYLAATGTLTFAPGVISQTFSVTITDDTLDEADETLELALSNPISATLGTPFTATLTILDDDAPPSVQFEAASFSVDEGAGSATITVTLSTVSAKTVGVSYATSDGTAKAGSDYLATAGSLTFAPGQLSQTFSVTITEDVLDEEDETLGLSLSVPTNATLGTPAAATLTILDNDAPPSVQFNPTLYLANEDSGSATMWATLSAKSGRTVVVTYTTSDGTASAGSDYGAASDTLTFNPGQTSRYFTVAITDDTMDEPSETVNLALSNPINATLNPPADHATLRIDDNDEPPSVQFETAGFLVDENGGLATITTLLSAPSGFEVSVDYATSDGTAKAGSDYLTATGTLAFAPGQITQTFSVTITNDLVDEADETLELALNHPVNATPGTPFTATLTILDDDTSSKVYLPIIVRN